MDTLKPSFVILENKKCFRKCDKFQNEAMTQLKQNQSQSFLEEREESEKINESDIFYSDDLKVEKDLDDYVHHFKLAHSFYGKIIGSKGTMINKIKNETGAKVDVPRNEKSNEITIRSTSKKNIIRAKQWILRLVQESREKAEPTHFISILFNTNEIKQNFETFKNEVLAENEINLKKKRISSDLFQQSSRLHLTICVLTIMDSEELNQALNVFKKCVTEKIIPRLGDEKIVIQLSGLNYMNDDPSMIDVLYGKVETLKGPITLQEIADSVADEFKKTDLMVKQVNQNVKLHVTLLNSRYRKHQAMINVKKEKKQESSSFDGTDILKQHSKYYFGSLHLNKLHLLIRHSFDENNCYKSSYSIDLLK